MTRFWILAIVAVLGMMLSAGSSAPAQNAKANHTERLVVPKLLNHDELMGMTAENRAAYLDQVRHTLVQLEALQKKIPSSKKNLASRAMIHDMIAQFTWINSIYSDVAPAAHSQPCAQGCTGG